jgi:tRNA pseudouridine38-40 synthase
LTPRPPSLRNLKLVLEFDGTAYAGWQYQPDRPTIQAALTAAVERVTGSRVTVHGCGRTDAGVSARAYVANFHSDTTLPAEKLHRALNWHLPDDIHVMSVEDADPGFGARHSARSKTYCHRIIRGRSPLRSRFAWEFLHPLDAAKMRAAARLLVGRRDFRPFCQTRDENGICNVLSIVVGAVGDEITVAVTGDRFLYKMVRRIVGALVAYGSGRLNLADIRAALAGRAHRPFQTAPAPGLLLHSVEY